MLDGPWSLLAATMGTHGRTPDARMLSRLAAATRAAVMRPSHSESPAFLLRKFWWVPCAFLTEESGGDICAWVGGFVANVCLGVGTCRTCRPMKTLRKA